MIEETEEEEAGKELADFFRDIKAPVWIIFGFLLIIGLFFGLTFVRHEKH